MTRLAIDAMGGDFAPIEIIKGTIMALSKTSDLEVNLYGNRNIINFLLKENIDSKFFINITKKIKIVHTDNFLSMDVKNLREQLRTKSDASMFLALKDANDNKVDGVISAGPSQALVLACHLFIKKFYFMKRIAFAPIYNSFDNRTRILLDAGANIDLKPENLLSFAICATIIAKELFDIKNPEIKLLNIGSESSKGRFLELETYKLLSQEKKINFGGNEEPQNLLTTTADILLSDGFTANIALKTYKGAINNLSKAFKKILTDGFFVKIISKLFFSKQILNMKKKIDPNEVGGAMILGLKKIVIKAHGSSASYSFYKAILQGKKLIESDVIYKTSKYFNDNKKLNVNNIN
ncbi:MAG: phosphate acyltransferase PlsX [Candidatus Phytoplasma pyri]